MRRLITPLALLPFISLLIVTPARIASGRVTDLRQQSSQDQRGAGSRDASEKDIQEIEPGKPLRRQLVGAQRHRYRIRLGAGQYLQVVLEQDGINVAIQVLGPDGKRILEVDSEIRDHGQESVSLVCETAGDHELIVWSKQKGENSGHYEIRIAELRVATAEDRSLHEARKLIEQGLEPQRAGRYDEALSLISRALEIREKILGPDHSDLASTINFQANLYYSKGVYAHAESLYQRALEIREKALGQDHPHVASSLNNLANVLIDRGEYAKAEPMHLRSLEIWEKALGAEHLGVADALNNLALLYDEMGDYAKAEPMHQRALRIREKNLGMDHIDVGESLNNLGILYAIGGEYAKAEPLYLRALSIREKVEGPDHPNVADVVNNLALLRRDRGDYDQAESLFQRAVRIREIKLRPDHPIIANSLDNLADIYRYKGDYAKSEKHYQRALAIRESELGNEHPLVARVLNKMAILHREKGEYEKSESLHRRALAILEKKFGPDHPDVAYSLNGMADLHVDRGEFTLAEPLFRRSLAILEKNMGPRHISLANIYNHLAALCVTKGAIDKAVEYQSTANAISEQNLAPNLIVLSERQKLAYLSTLSEQTDRTISLHLRHASNHPEAASQAVTLVLQRKGRALDAASENLNALRSRFTAEDRALLDKLTDARTRIAKLIFEGPREMPLDQYRERIKTLDEQAEGFEADISRKSDEFPVRSKPITLEAVQSAIPDDAALIEFASYKPFNPETAKNNDAYGPSRYVAYVIRHQGKVQWKELGEGKPIDNAIARLRKAMRDPNRKDVKYLARSVDRIIFQPLRPLLGDLSKLLISPEGELNLIPFAALADERGRYLLESYSISYLASGRDLLRLQTPRKSQSGPLVIADPDFGGRRGVEATRLLKQTKSGNKKKPATNPAGALSQFYFPALPQTAEEGEALRSLLPSATLLTKREASKTALGRIQSPEILHIATHGFFLEDLKMISNGDRGARVSTGDDSRRLRQVEKDGSRVENPLLRAGLALAGANEQRGEDNGILTALEMTGLNLWGTKLVTLSACDTGVGEVRNGDGVHGLRRALSLAGAETQVMSLWPVSDRWTRELMVSYYRRLKLGEGRGAALRQAQLEMLRNVNRRHPYFWAGFIQSGEWANLDGKREK